MHMIDTSHTGSASSHRTAVVAIMVSILVVVMVTGSWAGR